MLITTFDQLVSSGQNFLLLVLAARAVSPRDFGAFTLIYAIVVLVTGTFRGLFAEASLLGFATHSQDQQREASAVAITLTLVSGLVLAVLLLTVGIALPHILRGPFIAVAISVPGLTLLDVQRFLAVMRKLPGRLLFLDICWVLAWVAGLGAWRPGTPQGQMYVYGLSATIVAVLFFLVGERSLCALSVAVAAWWRGVRRNSMPLLAEYVAMNSTAQISTILLVALLGYAATGGLRGASALLNPITTLGLSMRIAIVPEVMRSGGSETPRGRRMLLGSAAFAGSISVITTAVLLTLSPQAGRAIMGATWSTAHHLIPAVGLGAFFNAITLRATLAMRADLKLRLIARYRAIGAVMTIAVAAIFAALTTLEATAWALGGVVATQFVVAEYLARTSRSGRHQEHVDSTASRADVIFAPES
jgi:O-antigen/teichoic acid export membrane protein